MSSASPEALIGIDPDDTKRVLVGGATFHLGTLTALQWESIQGRSIVARNEAHAAAIKAVQAKGLDPAEVMYREGIVELTRADIAISDDKQWQETMYHIRHDAVRWSLRAFENFVDPRKYPIPFEKDAEGYVTGRTLRILDRNSAITGLLYSEIVKLNTLGGDAKKS